MAKGPLLTVFVAMMLGVNAPATAQFSPEPPSAAAAKMRPIRLARIVVGIKRGEKIGTAKAMFCLLASEITWKNGTTSVSDEEFDEIFREEMRKGGFALAGDPSNLFEEPGDAPGDFQVGGLIKRIDMDVCYPNWTAQNPDDDRSRGNATVEVEWQVYSSLDRKVVGRLQTTGVVRGAKQDGGPWSILFLAFGDAARQLAANDRLRTALSGPPTDNKVARTAPTNIAPLQMRTSTAAPASVADAVSSTVLLRVNGGFGSGFLISPDGYVLTNQHVVGNAEYVKVRWPDGTEALGEVVRSDRARDVAIVKTDARGRKPLRLRSQPVIIGEDVFAIGAPAAEEHQNTVTKGIVSAMRVLDGLNFIQSDVGVTHGNSGGPVVDAKGQVVAITVRGRTDAQMVNFFIPISEAQQFLGLQMLPPAK